MNRLDLWILVAAMTGTTTGCAADGDDDPSAAEETGAATTEPDTGDDTAGAQGESSTGDDPDAAYDCVDPELVVARPLSGPGYDPATGFTDPSQTSYVAHTTQLLVHPDADTQAEFLQLVAGITEQLESAEGFVGLSLAIEPNCGFSRTLGLWRSEQDMYRFVSSGAHAVAMSRTLDVSSTGKVLHWEITADEVPTWEDAMARLADHDASPIYD